MNPDALRAGLRNKTLDAILFPTDPVANAAALVNALKTVFPPARDPPVRPHAQPRLRAGDRERRARRRLRVRRQPLGADGPVHAAFPPTAAGLPERCWSCTPTRSACGTTARRVLTRRDALRLADRPRQFSGDSRCGCARARRSSSRPAAITPSSRCRAGSRRCERLKISWPTRQPAAEADRLPGDHLQHAPDRRGAGVLRGSAASASRPCSASTRCGSPTTVRRHLRHRVQAQVQGHDVLRRRRRRPLHRPRAQARRGQWSIDLWLFSIGGPFDHTFGDDRPPAALPAADPLPPLVAALKDPRTGARRSGAAHAREPPQRAARDVFVHPLGGSPCARRCCRSGSSSTASPAACRGASATTITSATVGGAP